jgi:NAD dependent epimerase/dehydratase family enzyme
MLLGGARVEPHVLSTAGFEFEYPQLEPALRHVLA